MIDRLHLAPARYRALQRDTERYRVEPANPLLTSGPTTFMGVPVQESRMLPIDRRCGECGGTGEGATSTYCPACKGHGGDRIVGIMVGRLDRPPVVMAEPLRNKRPPYFPTGLVPPRPIR